jgi:hypothetical protein
MESMESHDAGFPPFPHSLEIPLGFPHSHGLDDWIYVFSYFFNSNHRHRKGLVTDVSGPQRNVCPGTLSVLADGMLNWSGGLLLMSSAWGGVELRLVNCGLFENDRRKAMATAKATAGPSLRSGQTFAGYMRIPPLTR